MFVVAIWFRSISISHTSVNSSVDNFHSSGGALVVRLQHKGVHLQPMINQKGWLCCKASPKWLAPPFSALKRSRDTAKNDLA